MSSRRRALSTLVALVAASLALGAANAGAAPLDWQACSYAPGFQCADMQAPLDYDQPNGAQITVAVMRHPATDPAHRAGSLFWNAGGPGGVPTDTLPDFVSFFSPTIRARYDIVTLDPRGLGRSTQLQCYADFDDELALNAAQSPGGWPYTAAEEQHTIALWSGFDQACAQHGGPIKFHMSTANVARDMDRVRAAIGEPKLNYWGPSYGTYLGVTYANLFPSRAGRIVLDGNVPPVEWNDAKAGATMNTFSRIQSPLGTEIALQMMLKECGKVDAARCSFSAGSPAATAAKFRTLMTRLKAGPVTGGGQTYSYNLVIGTGLELIEFPVAYPPQLPFGWKDLADLLQAAWSAANPGASAAPAATPRVLTQAASAPGIGLRPPLATPYPPSALEGLWGVLCGESPNPRDPASYRGQAERTNATQSPSGWGYPWTWFAEPCAEWTARDADAYRGPWTRSPAPYLLIGTIGDANTAYTGTLKMAAEVGGNARILTETGGGHTGWLNKSDCIDGYVDAFLLNGTLPPVDATCNQNKAPF